jgi:hypothetical protein
MRSYGRIGVCVLAVMMMCGSAFAALQSFITMTDGYFFDTTTGKPWVPHGIAYQTWNRPLGVWQTQDQIDYDLDEMKKMGANSIRVDFVWQHIEEKGDNIWSWTNYDYLVQACDKRDMRIFALVGYQWPPSWFPDSYYTMHPPGYDSDGIYHTNRWQSDIINYELPAARAQYSNFLYTVCNRYKDSKAVAGWIVGNEYGYLGLWSLKYDGYDPNCEAAFRTWCTARYTAITNLNKVWGSSYTNFNQIVLQDQYEWMGPKGAEWADMVQWREDSIASFTAAGARAARAGDTNHLLSYSTVGMQWGEEDWRYHAEDRGKIARACASNSAALAFFSINNYPWALDGSETRNGQWGISYTKKTAGMPVLYTETGFTSSEDLFPGLTEARQGGLIRNALWESLEAGAIGTHIFTWQDRPWISNREKGFGILYGDRTIKPAFWTSRDTFNLMEQMKIADLLKGSADPKPDIAFLWDDATDSQYVRFENEMQHEAGALERLGYEPSFILGLGELASGAYTNYKAIILPRNMRVSDTVPGTTNSVLNFLLTQVLTKGIHVIAVADLPGMQDRWGKPRAAFSNEVSQLFGIDASDVGGIQPPGEMYESILRQYYHKISVRYNTNGPAGLRNYAYSPSVWKCNDRVRVNGNGGTLWAVMDSGTNRGYEASSTTLAGWNTWGINEVRQWGWQFEGTNMVRLVGWAGHWQNFLAIPGQKYTADAYMRNNSDDGLSNGTYGVVAIEWYNGTNFIGSAESPRLTAANNAWQNFSVSSIAPSNASYGRIVRKLDRATNTPIGSLYFDADTFKPAVVAKSHGAGKAVIVLCSLDVLPDGTGDGEPDNLPYKWRSDILGGILKDYCGVQPAVSAVGTNAYLCLPEYRTCTNGAILMQVKNYAYDRYAANGGSPQTFTLQSSLFNGKTVRAFEQGRILATNSNGTITLTLQPDGHEMLYAYSPGTNRTELVQIKDAPGVLHPLGDKVSKVTVKFDCRNTTGLKLKVAFKEAGDNGDGTANEIYAVVTNAVSGAGDADLYLWIPDYNQNDTDYKSTPDGGKYEFASWLETSGGQRVAEAVPAPTILEWGVRPTAAVPTNLTKGATYSLPVEWEDLYEPLWWKNTPLARNSAFPTRVAVFRSSKTESQYPGQFTKVNAVCDWLQTLGYSNSNPQDVLFDDVRVNGSYFDDFNDGNYNGWSRLAGCANWAVSASPASGTSGTVGYWKCDEAAWNGAVGQVVDSSGRANHGQSFNGARTTNDARRTRAGWFSVTNYVQCTNTTSLQVNSNLTLSFWIKGQNIGAGRINPLDKSYGGEFSLTIETNRSLNFFHGKARVSGQYISWAALPAGGVTNGVWQHITITRDAATRSLKSYVNGVLKNSTTYTVTTNNAPTVSTYPVLIARGYTGYGLSGVMDEIKIYNTCLTPAQVSEDYRNTGSAYSLRAYRIGNDDNIMLASGVFTNAAVSADIRYTKQGYYFSDAELLFRFVDRNNHYKVGIRNYYGTWHIKYTVKAGGQVVQQGWLYDFPKTNRPVENLWYTLKVEAYGSTNKVYFNNTLVGTFWATNFASGKVALGTRAEQLGVWEPQKGYYFIDDDENGMSGQPLNLDWGYLQQFYSTLILPSTYVMNDKEASNVVTWATNGLHSLLATDGGVAMKNETGAFDLGRLEKLFGVGTSTRSMSGINRAVLGTTEHYVTLDYSPGAQLSATGSAVAFSALAGGVNLGTAYTASNNALAFVCNVITNNPGAPVKVFCFNYGADTSGQLTSQARNLAKRAFEWVRNDAFKLKVSLMYMANPGAPAGDFAVYTTNIWVLAGSGTSTVNVTLPTDGIMTGTNLYWLYTIYPWDASDAWSTHAGFYSSGNEGVKARIPGTGLQIFGITEKAFAGRDWDMWVGYNTVTNNTLSLAYGIKDKGATQYEDNFNDGNSTGWNIEASPRITWSVTNNSLQARVASVTTGGYSYIYWNGLAVTGKNITIEYSTTFTNGGLDGGVIYGGRVLYVNPNLCGWADNTPNYFSVNRPTTGKWHKVVVQIRDGSPYLLSDLFVDNKTVFLSEPIQVTSWTTNTIGFLSPYSNLNGVARWDNVRIADEQYSVTYTNLSGEKVPTNAQPTFWPSIPDYDPAMWEHEGTTLGASYEWYAYFHGEGVHSYSNAKVYFAPRLRVELASFPTNLSAGTNVVVPVEWENLPTNSVKLRVRLFDAYTGLIHVEKTNSISGVTGTTNVAVTIPTMPAGSNYVWSVFMYLNNAANPWGERIGSDDTFRFDDKGIGVEPETMIRYNGPPATGGFYNVYSDGGIPTGASIFTWDSYSAWGVGTGPATFNGDYTGITPPEGTKSFLAATVNSTTYAGWGIFRSGTDMRTYSNGYLKFWIRSGTTVKVDLEGPQNTKRTVSVPTTTNTWRAVSLPVSSFSGVVLTNMYGLFEATVESTAQTFYIDDIRWSTTP